MKLFSLFLFMDFIFTKPASKFGCLYTIDNGLVPISQT